MDKLHHKCVYLNENEKCPFSNITFGDRILCLENIVAIAASVSDSHIIACNTVKFIVRGDGSKVLLKRSSELSTEDYLHLQSDKVFLPSGGRSFSAPLYLF